MNVRETLIARPQVTFLLACMSCCLMTLGTSLSRAQEGARAPVSAPRPPVEAVRPEIDEAPAEPPSDESPQDSAPPGEAEPESAGDEESAEATSRPDVSSQHDPANRAELEAFFDGIMLTQLESKHIAGATVAVVADGEIVFSKGYGFADYDERKPVDPKTTMFRIGSVSKLLTWTAVMQLVEQGKLDLDADVNTYLDGSGVKVPDTFSEPITLKDLLTHTPGFEDSVIGLFGRTAADVGPLEEILSKLPRRVRPPGQLASYSNHGTALAGLIVSQVSGQPWEDYIDQNILEPLGMSHTTVRQPPRADLPEEMSHGYKYKGGRFEEEDFEYVPPAPAGSASSSAHDMAKFILAHLQDGEYGSNRILSEASARQMRERLFEHDPRLDAMCYGFWETNRNGRRILHHGGDTIVFHSLLAFLPDEGVGLFISYNTDTGTGRQAVLHAYLDRFFPVAEQPPIKPPDGFEQRAGQFTGAYKFIRHDYSTLAKLQALISVASVKAGDDGTLILSGALGSGGRRFAEVDHLLFQEVDGQDRIAFREDDQGRITHLFLNAVPAIALEKLKWYESPEFHLPLLGGCALLFASAVIGWPFVVLVTRGKLIAGKRRTFMSVLFTWLGWTGSVVFLAFLGGFALLVMQNPNEIVFGISDELKLLLLVPQACAGIAGLLLICSLVSWVRSYWRFTGRVHYLLVALAGVGFVGFLYFWNLLKFGA